MSFPLDRIVLATNNKHKVTEIKSILKKAGLSLKVLTLADFPKRKPVVENKKTIEGNAKKKAIEVAKQTRCLSLSDDTGLFIDALKGAPGVYSARFAGPGCSFQDNNEKVLKKLNKTPFQKRTASFRCVAALATPSGKTILAKGEIRGFIAENISGRQGFGYDPVFWVPQYKKTFAEMSASLKNKISHRALAFKQIPKNVRELFKNLN
ncbi:MAG: RdgB/HAM1 family non-canonical purine NTP pyrophosphatase [Elusimicrobiota bacterium]